MTALTRVCWRPVSLPRLSRCRTTLPNNIRFNSSAVAVPNLPKNQNVSSQPTKIEKIILDHIKTIGPISFATYMQLCLSHPTDGYYMNPANKVFGAAGDFITSPEISQTFGELIALWLLQEYKRTRVNAPIRLVELGPGKGTLMADILRVIQKFQPQSTFHIHLVETSHAMREQQKTRLSIPSNQNVQLHWHDSIDEIQPSSSEYTMLVAHEFFDALPIHILHKSKETSLWHEVLIASNEESNDISSSTINNKTSEPETEPEPKSNTPTPNSAPNPETHVPPLQTPPPPPPPPPSETPTRSLRRVLSAKPSNVGAVLGLSSPRFGEIEPGSYLEVSPTSFRIARKVGELLASVPSTANANTKIEGEGEGTGNVEGGEAEPSIGGCGLIIDYGGAKAYGDSVRAFKNHEIVDVFQEPGNCDITANVDFAYLKESMSDLVRPLGPISQGSFLARMGLGLRLRTLLRAAGSDERQEAIHGAAMRLIDPKRMGGQYQVLGITSHTRPDPAGSSPSELWPFHEVEKEKPKSDE